MSSVALRSNAAQLTTTVAAPFTDDPAAKHTAAAATVSMECRKCISAGLGCLGRVGSLLGLVAAGMFAETVESKSTRAWMLGTRSRTSQPRSQSLLRAAARNRRDAFAGC